MQAMLLERFREANKEEKTSTHSFQEEGQFHSIWGYRKKHLPPKHTILIRRWAGQEESLEKGTY